MPIHAGAPERAGNPTYGNPPEGTVITNRHQREPTITQKNCSRMSPLPERRQTATPPRTLEKAPDNPGPRHPNITWPPLSQNAGLWRTGWSLCGVAIEQFSRRVCMPGVSSRLVDEMEEHPPEVLILSPSRSVRGMGDRQRPDRGIRGDRPLRRFARRRGASDPGSAEVLPRCD